MSAKTVIPEGVIISGSLTSSSDTEVSGKIEGDVVVEGRLLLGTSALISGNVKATVCRVDGMVDGKVECTQDLDIGESGRLTADAIAANKIVLAGQVTGHVSTGGTLRLLPTARIAGDIRARSIVIEEGAFFNGKCIMRPSGESKPVPVGEKKEQPRS
jgi:cytoskeletal protein CcmA (bactofilin family)